MKKINEIKGGKSLYICMYIIVDLFIACYIALYQLCIFRFTSIFDIVHKTESDTTGILIHMREEIL